jgi:hypothetical protein
MIAVASIGGGLLLDDQAAGGHPVEVIEELVGAGAERADKDADLRAGGDDLLPVSTELSNSALTVCSFLMTSSPFAPAGTGTSLGTY